MHGEWFSFPHDNPVAAVTDAVGTYQLPPGMVDRARSARAPGPPLHTLALTGAEWATIDWLRSHGGAGAAVRASPAAVAEDIHATETTAKTALARLVKLNTLLKTSPRSQTYQLNPRRFWEGSGDAQVQACRRLDPPPIKPDAKALTAAKKAADKRTGKTPSAVTEPAAGSASPPRPRRASQTMTTGGTR